MSLYRFKSRETGDLVMLQANGKRILEILGKDVAGPGILRPEEMPGAIAALRAAAQAEEEAQEKMKDEALANGEPVPQFDAVSLRMRAAPLIEMLQRCSKAEVEVVWGV
ncbi:DUF1840 domain-containing protein [Hydrogenophaga pseudoflava]|uniref:DUF1840 domain-containing protein n=1 Tax=Hydrogenophaga pseudoflava TaxID=47421 RepID=UPI0027E4DFEB|nr:DUF1840 domain-containing protein [Hydrogenophaga pseudoflava]MDQ7745180.1 DUF1840 domain-containing protein [Hydrogenophaga pseudoflava]